VGLFINGANMLELGLPVNVAIGNNPSSLTPEGLLAVGSDPLGVTGREK